MSVRFGGALRNASDRPIMADLGRPDNYEPTATRSNLRPTTNQAFAAGCQPVTQHQSTVTHDCQWRVPCDESCSRPSNMWLSSSISSGVTFSPVISSIMTMVCANVRPTVMLASDLHSWHIHVAVGNR